jgi:alpha-beta hydrolase superfamily lysophospholipase
VSSFEGYLRDFDLLVQEFHLQPQRTALFGHSMGGLVMTRFAQTRNQNWAALAMTAPLLGIAVPIPAWKWWAGRLLARIAPRTHLKTDIREANMTSDPTFLAARHADPMIQRAVTVRWFFAMLAALEQAHQEAAKLTAPILILQGTADRTTDPLAPSDWLRRTHNPASRLMDYPGGLHELLNDTAWRTVCADLLDWLEQRVPKDR